MSDQTSRFVGTFSGIHFGAKQKKGDIVQTAGLNFDVELDETSLSQVTGIIGLQKQQVHLAVSRRQPSLFDGKPPAGTPDPQGKLPLAPEPERADPEQRSKTWREIEVLGPDKKLHSILRRADGLAFYCMDCGEGFEFDPGENIEAGIRNHACDTDESLLANLEFSNLEATLKLPCRDGVTREFGYTISHWRKESGPAFDCEECGEIVPVSGQEADERFFPLARMAAHVCPPVCHKCHAEKKYGAVFAESLRFHHPDCPLGKLHDPETAVATALDVQGADPYAARVEAALDFEAAEFLLEDATEAFARIEEECGLARHVGRKDRNDYKAAHALSKKDRKAILTGVKKFSKNAWNRMEVLLQDIDAAKVALDGIRRREQEEINRKDSERYDRERAEEDRKERERIAQVLAGPAQPYDGMLHQALTRAEGALEDWDKARSQGRDQDDLLNLIRAALGPDGGLNVPGETSVSWKAGDYYYPKFWFGPATGKPTLEESALVDAVRRVMQVPAAAEEPDGTDPDAEKDDEELPEDDGDIVEADPADPATFDHMLRYALCRGRVSEASWQCDRKEGLSDADLKDRIGVEFRGDGGSAKPGYPPVAYRGGKEPEFWYNTYSRGVRGEPRLTGKPLVDAVRRVMEIPFPVEQEAP